MSVRVVLGTATPGGGFPLYGDAVAAVINDADRALQVETRHTKGSTANVPLLESGELDLALVQGEVAHEALNGIGRPPARIHVLSAMYSTAGMFVVRGDSAARTIEDLKGQAVAFGARGSGLVILARNVLDGLGLDQQRDFQAVFLDRAGDGPAMVLDRSVAALWGGRRGVAGLRGGGGKPPGGALRHPRRRWHPANPGPPSVSQGVDGGGRILSGADDSHRLRRLVELHHGATDAP
jgi:uncharacterized protein